MGDDGSHRLAQRGVLLYASCVHNKSSHRWRRVVYARLHVSPFADETVARSILTPSYARVVRAQRSPSMSSRQLGNAYVDRGKNRESIFFWRFLRLGLLEETSSSERRVGTGCCFSPTQVARVAFRTLFRNQDYILVIPRNLPVTPRLYALRRSRSTPPVIVLFSVLRVAFWTSGE